MITIACREICQRNPITQLPFLSKPIMLDRAKLNYNYYFEQFKDLYSMPKLCSKVSLHADKLIFISNYINV